MKRSNSGLSRFFNRIEFYDDKVVKSSENKDKLRAEYIYYQLITPKLRAYMVKPYNYSENDETAQYSMRKINAPDVSRKWVAGELDEEIFKHLMDEIFRYLKGRPTKFVEKSEHGLYANSLYKEKVQQRIADYLSIINDREGDLPCTSSEIKDLLNSVLAKYLKLYEVYATKNIDRKIVISHGDLCFSNMFFDKDQLLLIDPKGATSTKDLWMDTYYDLAKLSHSILGHYDFLVADMYDIVPQNVLNIQYRDELNSCRQIFRQYLDDYGYNYMIVRICEASLFLSMLPLHADDLRRTLGFILNANNILKDVENEK